MAPRPDDDMVVDRYLEVPRRFDQLARELDVLLARARVAAGMVVDDDQGRGVIFECALHDLPNVDRRLVHRAFGNRLVADQHVLGIQQ